MASELGSSQENRKRVEQAGSSASSVWSLCDDGDHVDLGDITPSISPVVFTDDQVRQITQQNSEIDVLSPPFLPEEQINDVQLLMTCSSPILSQDVVSYSAAELGSGFPHDNSPFKRDVSLHDAVDLKLDLFPGLSAMGELSEQKVEEKSLTRSADAKGGLDKGKGRSYSLRRSPRKQPQQKNVSRKSADTKKAGAKAKGGGEVSDGNAEPASRRRSPRNKLEEAKEKAEPEKSGTQAERSPATQRKNRKQETAVKQEEPTKNIRRSPRIQKKPEKEDTGKGKQAGTPKRGRPSKKQNASSNEDDKKAECLPNEQSTDQGGAKVGEDKHSNKVGEEKPQESAGQIESEKEKPDAEKSTERERSGPEKQTKKVGKSGGAKDGGGSSCDKEQGRRRSGRVTRSRKNAGVEAKDEDRKAEEAEATGIDVSSSTGAGEVEGKDKGGLKGDDMPKEDSQEAEVKQGAGLATKEAGDEVPLSQLKSKVKKEQKTPKMKEELEGEKQELDKGLTKKEPKDSKKVEKKGDEQQAEPRSKRVRKATEKGREYFQETKKPIADKKQKEEEEVKEKEKEEKEEKEDVLSSESSEISDSEPEEYDSDYDPENDPTRLWCLCRQPHGNRFMICCDLCEMWFHGDCVGISMSQGRQMEKIGKEYVCPKCIAKEKEPAGAKPGTGKAKGEEEGERRTEKRRKYRRLKMPTDPTKEHHRKHRHSSKEHGKEGLSVNAFYKSDETRKRSQGSTGFKIPKKVRTTPTPVSYKMSQSQQQCLVADCPNHTQPHSLYCSDDCIKRHADDCLKVLHAEKQKQLGKQQAAKVATSPSGNPTSPWDSSGPPVTSSGESHSREGVAVWEKSTGRVIAGMAAPSEAELFAWLKKHPTFSVLKPTVPKEDKKKAKKDDERTIRENVKRSLKDILASRGKEVETLRLNTEDINKCAVTVEEELFKVFGDTGPRYKNKYRSLMFNLKDPRNKALFQHVLTGEISADRFVRMTPEQLASHELAKWREREVKHTLDMIKQTQEPSKFQVMKKTHKGEVAIDEDEDMSTLETTVKPAAGGEPAEASELPDSSDATPSAVLLDTTEEHRTHLFDLNCRICTGKITPPGEPPKKEPAIPLVSTTTIVQAVAESSVPSPPPTAEVPTVRSPDSVSTASMAQSPSDAVKPARKASAAWKGFVMMGGVAKFSTNAYRVSGPCDDLLTLLPDTLHVQGRIRHEQVWKYIQQLKASTSRDVSIIRYEASSDEEKISYASLYSYFYSRQRCGVISNCYSGVKDMYVVPLASHQPVPRELLPFNGPGLDEPRPHMLLGVIVRTKAAFKRPRSMNQRTASPPRKRRPSTGSGNESPLRDSPVAEIDDIVFQFNSGQAKRALPGDGTETTPSRKSAPLSTVAETTSSSTTPSEATSSARASPAKETATSLDVQKQQLLELQERARNYILSQVQAKGTKSGEGALAAGLADKTSEGSEPYNPEESEPYNPEEGTDDETPYDPEEELVLDVEPEKSEKTRPLVATGGESGVSSSGAGQPPLIPLSILAHLPPTASQVPSVSLPGSAPGPRPSLLQDPRTAVASSPGTQASGQPPAEAPLGLMQGSSGPGLRQVAGSAPGPNSAEATRSAPVFQGLKSGAATEDGGSRGSVDRPSFGGGPSQSDHGSSRPNTGDSRFAPSDPPQVGRTVEDLRQRPSEGPHVNPRENTYRERAQVEYGNNRVPPQHDQPGPHQGASHENAPPPSRDFNRGGYFPRGVPGRDPRDRGPGFHDEQFRERREPYGPPRRWSEEDHQRDRDRWRDREPHGRYEDHYDNRRRYEDFRRDDRRHDQYRRDRWRR